MAFGLKYELWCTSKKWNFFKAKIYFDGYVGSQIDRDIPAVAPFVWKKDKAEVVRGTSFDYSMREVVDFEFLEFYTNNSKKIKIELYKGTTLLWVGFNLPQQYQGAYTPPPTSLRFTATDGLGLLKNEPFALTGRNSEMAIICYCIDKIGLSLPYSIAIDIHGTGQATNRSCLEQTFSESVAFTDKNCYEVLQDVLGKYDAEITQWKGSWRITRTTCKKLTRFVYTSAGVYSTTESSPAVLNMDYPHKVGADCWPIGSLGMALEPGGKKIKITRNYGRKESLLENYKFIDYSSGNFSNWTKSGSTYWSYVTLSKRAAGDKRYAYLDGNVSGSDVYIEQIVPIQNATGYDFVYSLLAATVGYDLYGGIPISLPIDFRIMVYVEDGTNFYCLTKNGWGVINVSQLMTFTSASFTSANNIETLNANLKIMTSGIPLSGNIHVRLYSLNMTSYGSKTYLGVGYTEANAYFIKDGEQVPASSVVTAVFDNSSEPTDLSDLEIFSADAPDIANKKMIYKNITTISDGTPTLNWRIDGNGTDYTLIQLLGKTLASDNRKARQKLTGILRGAAMEPNSIVKHAYNNNIEYEIAECEWDIGEEKFNVTLLEILPWSSESVSYTTEDSTSINGSSSGGGSTSGGGSMVPGDVQLMLADWFQLVNPGGANEYLRVKKPIGCDYEIAAFTNTGYVPPSFWDSMPVSKSIIYTGGYAQLAGDIASPGNNKIYGTDGSGIKGWYTATGSGNVSNTGTPVANQIAIWTGATVIQGVSGLTFDGTNFTVTATNAKLKIDHIGESASGHGVVFDQKVSTIASASGYASINIAPGVVVTSPINGDIWYDNAMNAFRCYQGSNIKTMVADQSQTISGGGDYTCAVAEGDLNAMTLTFTPKGRNLFIMFSAPFYFSGNVSFNLLIYVAGSMLRTTKHYGASGVSYQIAMHGFTTVTPGNSITVKMRWSGTTSVLQRGSTDFPREMTIIDLP